MEEQLGNQNPIFNAEHRNNDTQRHLLLVIGKMNGLCSVDSQECDKEEKGPFEI